MIAATNFFDMIAMVSSDKQNKGPVNRPSQNSSIDFKNFIEKATSETRQNRSLDKVEAKYNKTEKDDKEVKSSSEVRQDRDFNKVEANKIENRKRVESKDDTQNNVNQLDKEDEEILNEVAEKLDVDAKTLVNLLQTLNIDLNSMSEIPLSTSEIAAKISEFVNSIVDSGDLLTINNGLNTALDIKNASMDEKINAISKELSNIMKPVKTDDEEKIQLDQYLDNSDIKKSELHASKQNDDVQVTGERVQTNPAEHQETMVVIADKKDEKTVEVIKDSNESASKVSQKEHPIVKAVEKEVQLAELVNKQEDVKADKANDKNEAQDSQGFANLVSKIKTVEVKQGTNVDGVHNNVMPLQQFETLMNKVETLKSVLQPSNAHKADVFDQVLENAKLVLTGNQTEMELNLKPESLGKLNLKIATENGMVMAKITTESQQVKQIIESNMIQLKEALNQQGLNIQQFSVSVGDNSKREMFNGQRFGNAKSNKVNQNSTNTVNAAESYVSRIMARNPYLVSESSFDYTA